jgi:tRNA threonylcarbamoyladenosine biosynthesis protein TsaE
MSIAGCLEVVTESADETREVGRSLGSLARPGDVFLLVGELGAGKTTLTQGILWGLGGDEYARSPTFVLVAEYEGRLTLYHIDLFRLGVVDEAYELGLEEYLDGDGLCVVEWADRAPDLLSQQHLAIHIERLGDTSRRLSLSCDAAEYGRYLDAVRPGR